MSVVFNFNINIVAGDISLIETHLAGISVLLKIQYSGIPGENPPIQKNNLQEEYLR